MNIDEILNMIDDMLEEAWSLPFSGGRCVVDAQKVKECIEDIRLNLPGEIKQAKMIVADRNDIIKSAERQAESARKGSGHHRTGADGCQGNPPRFPRILRLHPQGNRGKLEQLAEKCARHPSGAAQCDQQIQTADAKGKLI